MTVKPSYAKKPALLSELAKRIRNRRYALEMTQEELAEKAELHVNYIGEIERAKRNPSLICLVALAKALQVSPKELIPD
ncbi:MAG: helix-turn-helix transcriptional regulator [Parachlamydia sp.]|nr:helix-turn-helix transcriptional regulator [Parachlamydia sp.]